MSSRLSLEERVQVVLLYAKFESFVEVQRKWRNHFDTEPPSKPTILSLVEKFKETGSVHDRHRSGRPRSAVTKESIENVTELLNNSSNLSIRQGAQALDMSKDSYHRAVLEAGFRPFKPTILQELREDDFDRREEFCDTLLEKFTKEPSMVNKIVWSDESEFKLNGVINRHNCTYWAFSNPDEQMPVSNSKQGLMVWCGITSYGIIGPYFFDGLVTGESYLQMLQEFLWPQVKQRRLIFQQDGAPAHYSLQVRKWLDQKFPDRWIGRRGPIECPARSPDLTPPDFFLWGYLKNIVYRDRPSTLDELRDRIEQACAEIPENMCDRVCKSMVDRLKRCREAEGKQISN
jgi:transposase